MMTKKQFAEAIVQQFKREHNIMTDKALAERFGESDSRLTTALDALGMLDNIEHRSLDRALGYDGIEYIHTNQISGEITSLSIGEIIDLLPDSLD